MHFNSEQEILIFLENLPYTRKAIYDDEPGVILTKPMTLAPEFGFSIQDTLGPIFFTHYDNGKYWRLLAVIEHGENSLTEVDVDLTWDSENEHYLVEPLGVAVIAEIGFIQGYEFQGLAVLHQESSAAEYYETQVTKQLTSEKVHCLLAKFNNSSESPAYCFLEEGATIK